MTTTIGGRCGSLDRLFGVRGHDTLLHNRPLDCDAGPDGLRQGSPWAADAERGLVSEVIGAVSRSMDDDVEAQLRARHVNAIRTFSVPLMVAHLSCATVLTSVLFLTNHVTPAALIWAACLSLLALVGLLRERGKRNRVPPRTTRAGTVHRLVQGALIFGLVWAVPGLMFIPDLTGFSAVFAYTLLTGVLTVGAMALYPIPAAASAFMVPVAVGGLLGLATTFGLLAFGPCVLAAFLLYMVHRVSKRHADLFASEFVARVELEARGRLIEDLLEDARLEAVGTKQVIEERLSRAQKMDAIRQLTGGIAHNFNNLLTAIQGNAELLQLDETTDQTLVAPILDGCRRGAEQVQRLLSAAQKQMLFPEAVRLEPLVTGLIGVIEPSLGPRYSFSTDYDPDLAPVEVDPAQLEGALLNLILNARDAMPEGGEIVIRCRNLASGLRRGRLGRSRSPFQVAISVIDTGSGMSEEVRDKAIDPFFTTKSASAGSGLGLSSVAGFVRQSKGDISIETAPERGTTVTLRLPAATTPPEEPLVPPNHSLENETQTILLVEDFANVRAVTENMLISLGYNVLTARGPSEAMAVISGPETIDLVLTDILLSDSVTGIDLARSIREIRQDLPIALFSGWVQRLPEADPSVDTKILPKPFTRQQLENHVRRALATKARTPAP